MDKSEQAADVNVTGLLSFIEAVGGKLIIEAEFSEGEAAVTSFSDVRTTEGTL